jgi:hypothetical protein
LWEIDKSQVTSLPFLGYEGDYKPSDVSGKPRLYYDRKKPFNRDVPYYQTYKPTTEIIIPEAYIIPQSWWNAIELLKINNIEMVALLQDTEIEVETYRIADFKTTSYPFEGHYLHSNTKVITTTKKVLFHKGDLIINTQQPGVKYLIEALEPQGIDSYFAWNFFDAILQQKEYFSAYVFEDTAAKLLKEDKELRTAFEAKKQQDEAFANDGEAQLDWIYRHSVYYEKTHLEYPVYRKMK